MTVKKSENPYCGFKTDVARLLALLLRDLRLVLIAISCGGGGFALGRIIGWWS
jgi:hypothetical protein